LADRFNDDLVAAEEALQAETETAPDESHTWTIESRRSVIDHARSLLEAARDEALVAVLPAEAITLRDALEEAEMRGVEMTTLCLNGCSPSCAGCRGNIYKYRITEEVDTRWLVVAVDGREMLAGQIKVDGSASAVRTTQPLLVELASSYVRNSVVLSTLATWPEAGSTNCKRQ
jgi:sugar-specific transcriptional regulator TrmB